VDDLEIEALALVDTGFDGEIIVPRDMLRSDLGYEAVLTWRLADDSEVLARMYRGAVRIAGVEVTIPVSINALGHELLIGAALISRFRVILDHGTSVTFEL
jgi:clan AA aspartic protease